MFGKILIANRGEIACRIIKTTRTMGISTVAVYSDADRDALHVAMADEAVHIGASPATESYLVAERIIAAAKRTSAQAIHPGYGFLSENAEFSQLCADEGLVFIGPPAAAIAKMGSKSAAKSIMENANVPLVPGYHGENQDPTLIKNASDDMGYPVLLKAVAGGGGKGMRIVERSEDLTQALIEAKREAQSSFGNDDVLVEKYLRRARHVEVQVFFDTHGHGVYLFDRDCSIQRRHQKIIEEAPAPGLSDELRREMGEAALRAAKAIDYVGAGTVEFLLADAEKHQFYFMEMNTRLQVEHPVTEMITGYDLVSWQLRVAAGENLPAKQEAIQINGHAFEARIYAEDTTQNFCPSTGTLLHMASPAENDRLRVDTGFRTGDEISPYYDPMIAKIISWDNTRQAAARVLSKGIEDFQVAGVSTNISLIHRIFSMPEFLDAKVDTQFIDQHQPMLLNVPEYRSASDIALAALYLLLQRRQQSPDDMSPWAVFSDWRMNQSFACKLDIEIDSVVKTIAASVEPDSKDAFSLLIDDECYVVSGELDADKLIANIEGVRFIVTIVARSATEFILLNKASAMAFAIRGPDLGEGEAASDDGSCIAPMNGRIVDVMVSEGQSVEKNTALLVMEAMKMEHTVLAPTAGKIERISCQVDQLVTGGRELIHIAPQESG